MGGIDCINLEAADGPYLSWSRSCWRLLNRLQLSCDESYISAKWIPDPTIPVQLTGLSFSRFLDPAKVLHHLAVTQCWDRCRSPTENERRHGQSQLACGGSETKPAADLILQICLESENSEMCGSTHGHSPSRPLYKTRYENRCLEDIRVV